MFYISAQQRLLAENKKSIQSSGAAAGGDNKAAVRDFP